MNLPYSTNIQYLFFKKKNLNHIQEITANQIILLLNDLKKNDETTK